ncbi:MAG: DUF2723 domain-containing protein [Anaerolineae bacterium]|nr:DUF2723 domain-containing protein [Anaerolineae bacterium]
MAPSIVPGDPGEYQIIAARWGIGHPPGYGFYALLGNTFTHLVPIGSFAWRANLLSAVCGAIIVSLAYGMGRITSKAPYDTLRGQIPPILGALLLATGLDLWQHAIHANAHIVTALLAATSLFLLLLWRHTQQDRWLFVFCVVAGLSPAHHPLLVFAFPAYTLFILTVRPRIWQRWTLLKMFGFALLGLMIFFYYPVRCAIGSPPLPGPNDMNTWSGFVRVITAQGLRGNLFNFSGSEILYRLWDVRVPLRLQYTLPALVLAIIGLIELWVHRYRTALLITGYLIGITMMTVNVLQDAMAYLLGPMVIVGVLAGVGIDTLIGWLDKHLITWRTPAIVAAAALIALMPIWAAVINWTKMDLSHFNTSDEWLSMIRDRFDGQNERAIVLTEWERMTTVWYDQQIRGQQYSAQDITFVYIPAGKTFTQGVDENLSQGLVYLTMYRPFVAEKYRLIPSGELWQVLPTWPRELPDQANPTHILAPGHFEIVGWQLSEKEIRPGERLILDLYMRMPDPEGTEAQQTYLPWARLGETTYHFTTDSRFNTPWWQPGEIVVERFELPVSWMAAPGHYPLQIGIRLINEERDLILQTGQTLATLATIEVKSPDWRPLKSKLDAALGNLRGDILLRQVRINGRRMPTDKPLLIDPGEMLRVTLDWESLRPIEENYTVFVQLLDWNTWPPVRAQDDITPLGGSAPTLLWFPRWRRGTRIADTHLLDVPADLAPGQYPLVVGMYGFSTRKRVQNVLPNGDMEGDWITVGHMLVK